jgi:hypothetical protein
LSRNVFFTKFYPQKLDRDKTFFAVFLQEIIKFRPGFFKNEI